MPYSKGSDGGRCCDGRAVGGVTSFGTGPKLEFVLRDAIGRQEIGGSA